MDVRNDTTMKQVNSVYEFVCALVYFRCENILKCGRQWNKAFGANKHAISTKETEQNSICYVGMYLEALKDNSSHFHEHCSSTH